MKSFNFLKPLTSINNTLMDNKVQSSQLYNALFQNEFFILSSINYYPKFIKTYSVLQ